MNYREQLVEFYTTHNPDKLPLIDSILQSYAGREEQLLLDLRIKYGLETGNTSPPAQSDDGLSKYTKSFSRISDSVNDISTNISEFLSVKDLSKDKKSVTIMLPSEEATETLRRLESENEKLRQDVRKLLNDKTAQQHASDAAVSARKKSEQHVASLTKDLHEKTTALAAIEEERGVLVCRCENMASDVAELVSINHRMAAQITRLATHIVIYPTDTAAATESPELTDKSTEEASNTNSSAACHESRAEMLQAIIHASNVEMSILNKRLLDTERQLAASHKHATLLESRMQDAHTELAQITEKYDSLSRYHNNDKLELDDIMHRLQERSVAAAEAEDEVKRLRQLIEQLQKTKDDAIHACNDTIRSIEKAHEEKMNSFVESVMMQHEEAFSHVSEVAHHERELQVELLDAAQGRIDQLQVELFKVRRLVSQKEHDILDLRDKLELLEKKT